MFRTSCVARYARVYSAVEYHGEGSFYNPNPFSINSRPFVSSSFEDFLTLEVCRWIVQDIPLE